jgi:Ca2+-binding RTX toxin-like protein
MTVFTAYKAVNMNFLSELSTLNSTHNTLEFMDPSEYRILNPAGTIDLDFTSVPASPFQYLSPGPPTGGNIAALRVSTGPSALNLTLAYTLSSANVSVQTIETDLLNDDFAAVVSLVFGGADTIIGSTRSDVLGGFGGNDRITGRAGNDREIGGAGNDTFVFRAGFGKDVITDFSAGPAIGDVLDVHGLFANLAAVKNHAHVDSHQHLVIVFGAADTITLNTVHSKAALSLNDFHF